MNKSNEDKARQIINNLCEINKSIVEKIKIMDDKINKLEIEIKKVKRI